MHGRKNIKLQFYRVRKSQGNFVRNSLKFDSGGAKHRNYTGCEIYHENRHVVRNTDVLRNTRNDR